METQTESTKVKGKKFSTEGKTWKKKNIPLVNFKVSDPKGRPCVAEIEGVYLKRREAGENTDEDTGEVKARYTLIFEKLDGSGEKFQVWETAGLRGAIEMNDVQEGDAVKIVHLGKVPRSSGKGEVNQYDIFALSN